MAGAAPAAAADSSDGEDLAEFLAGLRQRYNLDAAAHEAATDAAAGPAGQAAAAAQLQPLSTDAAILGLHPAFRRSGATDAAAVSGSRSGLHAATAQQPTSSPSLRSGQPQEEGTTAREAAAAPAAPAAASESHGSCITPAQHTPAYSNGSQMAYAAGAQPGGGGGAVAAAATPHSTAAMHTATARQQAVGQSTAADVAATAPGAGGPGVAAAAAGATGAVLPAADDGVRSSSSSISSVAKPLLGAFAAAAAAGQDAHPQQQQQHLDIDAAIGSEVTLQSLVEGPHTISQQQHAAQPGSPTRPLSGAWAARAAAAAARPASATTTAVTDTAISNTSPPQHPAMAASAGGHPAGSVSGSAASPEASSRQQQGQQQQQESEQEEEDSASAATAAGSAAVAADWAHLSAQLSAAGFGHLALTQQQQQQEEAAGGAVTPQLTSLYGSFCKVLQEYQQRDGLLQQLLGERDEVRRASRRSSSENSKLEQQRDDALKATARLQAELTTVRTVEVPSIELRHKQALTRLDSEVARLKHSLKEAQAAAAAAAGADAAAAGSHAALQGQLHEAVRERERLRVECERLESELLRHKPLLKEADKAVAAARAAARQSDDQVVLLERELRQLGQQHSEETAALTAELGKARHAARDAEQQLAAVRAEAAAAAGDAPPELLRQLAAERAAHEEQQAHLTSELQALRQQLQQRQQASARAEAASKADGSAVLHAERRMSLQEKQHRADVAKLSAEVKQSRESAQLLQARLLQAEASAAEQGAAARGAEAAARESADRAAAAVCELDRLRSSSLQQQQQLGEQLQDSRRALAECQQQLAITEGELRRLRAAAGLADATAVAGGGGGGTAAAAAEVSGDTVAAAAASSTQRLGLEPQSSAKVVVVPPGASSSSGEAEDGSGSGSNKMPKPAAAAAAAHSTTSTTTSDLAAALSRAVAAEAAAGEAESALVALRYRCLQLEMAASRKEQEVEGLRDKLAQKVMREERRLARDKATYQRIKQAYAASGGSTTARRHAASAAAGGGSLGALELSSAGGSAGGGSGSRRAGAGAGPAGAVAAAARELRPVELVGLYEGQKEALERELAAAKAEVRVLGTQLRDAQNLLMSRDKAAAIAAAAAAGVKGRAGLAVSLCAAAADPAAVLAAQRKAAELQRELCSVRAEAASALRDAARQLAAAEAERSQLMGDVDALQQELQDRPTAADKRRLEREIDLLQRKIATLRRQAAAAQPGGVAAAAQDALDGGCGGDVSDVAGAGDRAADRSRGRGTKTAIERDKALARLRLGVVEEFPRDVLVDVVQDMCIVLELRDATLLVPSLKKVAAVAAAIPSVEAFVAQVCEVVLRQGLAFTPPQVLQQDAGLSPKCVPEVLQHWLQLLRQGELLHQFAQQLRSLMDQRCSSSSDGGGNSGGPDTLPDASDCSLSQVQQMCQQLLQQAQALVQVEADAVAAADVMGAARGLLVEQPEGLLQRLVLQLMQLLGVQQLEGLPAAANRVFVHYSELLNFLGAAVSLLGLPAESGPAAVMAALAGLVEQAARPPSKVRQAAAELQAAATKQQHLQQQLDRQEGEEEEEDGDQAAADRLPALLSLLGAESEQQAADRHKEMVARLRRLDQVLPRYQSVVSQLYDKLRVVSLDDLLPAVEQLLVQAKS